MSVSDLIPGAEVKTLSVSPSDILILQLPEGATRPGRDFDWSAFNGAQVIVLPHGFDLRKITDEERELIARRAT